MIKHVTLAKSKDSFGVIISLPITSISFAMGWISLFRLPIQKLIKTTDVENKN
jgi:hypothetical protein